jgi:glycosyltransferase involved in cell wall biosynthesis
MKLEVGVNLAGYFDSALGVGQVARRVRAALESTGVPVAPVALTAANAPRVDEPDRGLVAPEAAVHPLNLICVNPDGLAGARDELGPGFFEGRKTIGLWWWESGAFPERWLRAFDHVDELWAGSAHVAEELAAVAPVPVVRMPVPVTLPESGAQRGRLGLPDGFLFLASFDYNSVPERKNPLGALRAFAASGAAGRGAALVLKSIGGADRPEAREELAAAVAGVDGAHLFDEVLSDEDQAVLLRACDCYLSLHRSEGFGLPLAEAMLLGKPVIATAYSGPLDFLTPANSFLVDWRPVAIGPGNEPYPADGTWAEPDLDHAARLIGELLDDPDEAARRGARAREDLAREYSLEAAGAAMAARLRRLALLPTGRNGQVAGLDLGALEQRLGEEPPSPAPDVSLPRLRRLVRSAVLRATRMQQVHQRQVAEEVADALRSLDERIQGVAAAQATVQGQLAELERRLAELEQRSND